MAKLNKSVLGKISGSLGDVTFRQRNGKNYISVRPGSFTPGNDLQSIKRRAKFAISIKLAKYINSITQLKPLWRLATPQGLSPYNYIMKKNYAMITDTGISASLLLTPVIGFGINAASISVDASQLQIAFDAIGNTIALNTDIEKSFQILSLLHLSTPNESGFEANQFIILQSEKQPIVTDTALNFTIAYSNQETSIISKYTNKKSFSLLLTLDDDSKLVQYSNTISG